MPYLGASAEVPTGSASELATVDFALKRGVAIRGKVTDKVTGKPVAALVEFFTFADSPYRGDARRFHGGEVRTLADGSFVLAGLPGRGLVAARAEKDYFLVGQGADKISGADKNGWFLTSPHMCDPNFEHAIAEITPAEGAESATCNLVLDPGRRRQGTVEGPDGKPLAGCTAINLCPGTMSPNMVRLASAQFTAVALDPKQPRPLFFRHEEKKLAGVVMGKRRRDWTADRPPSAGRHRYRPPD